MYQPATFDRVRNVHFENVKALMEEADVSIAQTKKESYEFRRDVVMGGQNGQTGKTMAEKVLK